MNSPFYVVAIMLVTVALADHSRSKKEVTYDPYGRLTDSNKYLAASGYGYYSQQQPYYQSAQPYNHLFYQPQTHQRYPYNGNQQYYNQYSNLPYVHDNHHQPHYPHAYNQNAFDYPNSLDYDTTVIRQAPIYPSPGAQPISPPVPHPFYHPQEKTETPLEMANVLGDLRHHGKTIPLLLFENELETNDD